MISLYILYTYYIPIVQYSIILLPLMRKSIGGDFYERSYSNFPSLVWIAMIVTHIDQDLWNGCFNRHQSSDIDFGRLVDRKQPPGTTVDATDEITYD